MIASPSEGLMVLEEYCATRFCIWKAASLGGFKQFEYVKEL